MPMPVRMLLRRVTFKVLTSMHCLVYRLSGGKIAGKLNNIPILLLTTTGRRSGKPRTVPLGYLTDDDHLLVIGSYGGWSHDPAWVHNLRANPRVTVQIGRDTTPMRAEVAGPVQRQRLWTQITGQAPIYRRYDRNTTRQIPVIVLAPLNAKHAAAPSAPGSG